jgi:hypothetical protein
VQKLLRTTLTLFTASLSASAGASIFQITDSSGSFSMHAQMMNGLFADGSQTFTTGDLEALHTMLNTWGIDTDGKITVLPLNTSHGLTLVTLIDEERGAGDISFDSSIGVSSTGSNALGMFINDSTDDNRTIIESPFFNSQTLGTTFVWDSAESGDGFAWTDFTMGDTVSYTFTELDADSLDELAFQFASWENDSWGIVSVDAFKANGTNVFTGMVIPAPPAALLLTAVALGYRRRR